MREKPVTTASPLSTRRTRAAAATSSTRGRFAVSLGAEICPNPAARNT